MLRSPGPQLGDFLREVKAILRCRSAERNLHEWRIVCKAKLKLGGSLSCNGRAQNSALPPPKPRSVSTTEDEGCGWAKIGLLGSIAAAWGISSRLLKSHLWSTTQISFPPWKESFYATHTP